MNDSTGTSVEGLRVLRAARDVLNTIPPDDRMAALCGGLIRIIQCLLHPTQPKCSICGAPARYQVVWKRVTIPDEPDKWYCTEHRHQAEERDCINDYGDHYARKAAVPSTVKHPRSGDYYAVRMLNGNVVQAAGPLHYDPEHEWSTEELEGYLMNRSGYDLEDDAAWLQKELGAAS